MVLGIRWDSQNTPSNLTLIPLGGIIIVTPSFFRNTIGQNKAFLLMLATVWSPQKQQGKVSLHLGLLLHHPVAVMVASYPNKGWRKVGGLSLWLQFKWWRKTIRTSEIKPCSYLVWRDRREILLFFICHGSGAIAVLKKKMRRQKLREAKSCFQW